jgi:hypothetical protein
MSGNMHGRGRRNVAAERICGALFVGLTTLKGYFYINLDGTQCWVREYYLEHAQWGAAGGATKDQDCADRAALRGCNAAGVRLPPWEGPATLRVGPR